MGRGRQKAKQTKVARGLKYHTSSIDVHALQRELGGSEYEPSPPTIADPADEDEDPYAAYIADDDDEESVEGYASQGRRA